jgi:hypothetical protein
MSNYTKGKVRTAVAGIPGIETKGYEMHHCIRVTGSNHVIAITGKTDTGNEEFDANSEADAVRLAACWNAFEGVPTDDIQKCHVAKPIKINNRIGDGYRKLAAEYESNLEKYSSLKQTLDLINSLKEIGFKIDTSEFYKSAHKTIDPLKPSDNDRSFICPTEEEIDRLYVFSHAMGGKEFFVKELARIIAKKNGGAA